MGEGSSQPLHRWRWESPFLALHTRAWSYPGLFKGHSSLWLSQVPGVGNFSCGDSDFAIFCQASEKETAFFSGLQLYSELPKQQALLCTKGVGTDSLGRSVTD